MADLWRFVAARPDGFELGALRARSRRVSYRLDGVDASFSLFGRDATAAYVDELATDLKVYLGDRLMFRGRMGSSSDTLDETKHDLSVTALDYRALLGARILYDAYAATNREQTEIAWDLISGTQALSGGDLGIANLSIDTNVNRTRTFPEGQNIGEALDRLGKVTDGFDWEIDEFLNFRTYYPQRGQVSDAVLAHGSTVSRVRRTLTTSSFGNAVRVSGRERKLDEATNLWSGPIPAVRATAGIATDPRGRFDRQFGYPSVTVQSTLEERADLLIEDLPVLRPSWTMTMKPGAWKGRDRLWLGDSCEMVVKSGRLSDLGLQRVVGLDFVVGDDGTSTVDVILGLPPLSDSARRARIESEMRLQNLENDG